MARSQYALPSEARRSRSDDPRGLSEYIRETATKYGVDPEVALRVAKSEGLRSFKSGVIQKSGKEEPSWGAFQLYTGGGLGNQFKKDTGLDPSDPANEKATIDYALKTAAKVGWGPWHGAKNTGIGEFEGISGGGAKTAQTDPAAGYGGIGSDAAASERAATAVKGTQTDTSAPEVAQTAPAAPTGDFIDRLKNSPTGMQGLGEAITGLGQATAGTNRSMYDTAPVRSIAAPGMMTPAIVPTVDPKAAEGQRQQLALAMQRLNSGKLY